MISGNDKYQNKFTALAKYSHKNSCDKNIIPVCNGEEK